MSPDVLAILSPITVAAAVSLGLLVAVVRRGGGRHAMLELGTVYAAVVVVYTAYPLAGFLVNGLRYGESNDPRLFAIQPSATDVARIAWFYVAHLGGFAVAYVAARGRSGPVRLGDRGVSRLSLLVVVTLWLATQVYFFGLERTYGWHFETNLDRYVAFANLPLVVAQITGHLGAIRFTCEIAFLVLLFAAARRALVLVVPGLVLLAAATAAQHQSRTELVLLTFAAVLCFHLEVRPLSRSVLAALGGAGLVGFLWLGVTRAAPGEPGDGSFRRFFAANEFESLFGNACDLEQRVASGEIRSLPPGFFLADLLAPVPQQLLRTPKVAPSDWYMRTFLPEAAEQGMGFCFGSVSESIVGGGVPDAAARGVLLGLVFGAIHRFVAGRRPGTWWFVFYVWLTVLAYNSFRMTTLYLLVRVAYDFLPVVLCVKAFSRLRRLALGGFPEKSAPAAVP